MDARIVSNQVINSLQISVLKEVPSGNFNSTNSSGKCRPKDNRICYYILVQRCGLQIQK